MTLVEPVQISALCSIAATQEASSGINLVFDQQWMQLGRRMDNPGYIVGKAATNPKYQALSSTDAIALARNFIICDPKVVSSGTSSSPLEQSLFRTLASIAPTAPYQPGDIANWFNNNFNYVSGSNSSGSMPMRALLVPRSQVSNFVPNKFVFKGPGGSYNFGDAIISNGQRYVCISPNFVPWTLSPTGTPVAPPQDPLIQDPNWAYEPWTTAPTKTSVNTATFQQLYVAYWEVMADQYNTQTAPGIWSPEWDAATVPPEKCSATRLEAALQSPLKVTLYRRRSCISAPPSPRSTRWICATAMMM